jgi:hypothetical protein
MTDTPSDTPADVADAGAAPSRRAPRRLGLLVPWAVFALLCAAGTAWWFHVADRAQQAFDAWVEQRRAQGAQIEWSGRHLEGFPFRVGIVLEDVRLAEGTTRLSFKRLSANVVPTGERLLILDARGEAGLDMAGLPGAPWRVRADRLGLSVRWDEAGVFQRVSFNATRPAWTAAGGATGGAEAIDLHVAGVPGGDPRDLRVLAGASSLALPAGGAAPAPLRAALGTTVGWTQVAMVVPQGRDWLARPDRAGCLDWAARGGTLRVDEARVRWGALDAATHGTVSVDQDGAARGALTVRIAAVEALSGALAGPAPELARGLAGAALIGRRAGGTLEVPLSVGQGMLAIGPASVPGLPPICR